MGHEPKVRVAHVLRTLDFGGLQSLCLDIIRHSSDAIDHTIIVFGEQRTLEEQFRTLGCGVYAIPHRRSRFRVASREFFKLVRTLRVDVIMGWYYPFILRLLSPEWAYVVHVGTAYFRRPVLRYLKNWLIIRTAGARAVRYVYASHYVRSQHDATYGVHPRHSVVLHNAVDPSLFGRPAAAASHKNTFTVAMIGRMDGSKDFDSIIDVAPEVRARVPLFTLRLLGDGPLRHRLIERTTAMPYVSLPGATSRVAEELAKTDVMVFLNRRVEGFGLVLLEAMASECAVISCNRGASPEVIDHGVDGILVQDRDELLAALVELWEKPELRSMLVRNARSRVERTFDVKDLAKQYESLFRQSRRSQ